MLALQTISRQTFHETFAAVNSEANMKQYLEESLSLEKLGTELNNPESSFYFVKDGDEIIGYLKLNTGDAQTESQDKDALEIERIYVLKSYHGKEIGRLLFDKAMEEAQRRQSPYLWLGVWEENHRAISFYRKQGFEPFDTHLFHLGEDVQTDILMKINLNKP